METGAVFNKKVQEIQKIDKVTFKSQKEPRESQQYPK